MRDARAQARRKGHYHRGVAWCGVSEPQQGGAGTHMGLAQEGLKRVPTILHYNALQRGLEPENNSQAWGIGAIVD